MSSQASLSYCADYVRRNDRDRFLCALFARPEKREDLFTLYAFNQEISKTREVVSEAMLGHIRLQWWRDSLDGIGRGDVRKHEVVEPLARLINDGMVSTGDLAAMIDAREFDLADTAPADMAALDRYIDQTSGHMAVMAAGILGGDDAGNADAQMAARLAGNAYGLVGILRAVVFHGRGKRLYLPGDMLARHDVKQGDIFEFRKIDTVRAMTAELAGIARERITQARAMRRALPRRALAIGLQVTLAAHYLAKLEKAQHDLFSAEFGLARPASLRLMINSMIGRY